MAGIKDPTSTGLLGLSTGIGLGTNAFYDALPAGFTVNLVPARRTIGSASTVPFEADGQTDKSLKFCLTTGSVANDGVIEGTTPNRFYNKTGVTVPTGKYVLGTHE